MSFKGHRINNLVIIIAILIIAAIIRLINVNNHFSFLSWDAGWYYLSAQGFHKLITLFLGKLADLFKYFSSPLENRVFLDLLSQYRGENFTLEFIKPFYVLTLTFLLFIFPTSWHFYIPLFYNLIISLSTIIIAYLISKELRPFIKNDFILPLFTVFSGINIYFSHNSVSTNTATFLFSLLIVLTLKELSVARDRNRIAIGILLALLPATHESLILMPFVYCICLMLFKYSNRISLKGILQVSISFTIISLLFEFISVIKSWAILHFVGREVPTYFSHFFEHYRLNSSYRLPFPQYSLAYFLNNIRVFSGLIKISEGFLFLLIFGLAIFSILKEMIKKVQVLDIRIAFIYLIVFIPALIFIVNGFISFRILGFFIFGATIVVAIFIERIFRHRSIVYLIVFLCILFNFNQLKDLVSIKSPFLEVSTEIDKQFKKNKPPEKFIIFFSFPELEIFIEKAKLKGKTLYFRAVLPEVNEKLYQQYFVNIRRGILGTSVAGVFKENNNKLIKLLRNKGFKINVIAIFNNSLYEHPLVKYDALPARVKLIRSAMPAYDDYVLYEFTRD